MNTPEDLLDKYNIELYGLDRIHAIEAMEEYAEQFKPKEIIEQERTIKIIYESIASYFCLSLEYIKGYGRKREQVKCRQLIAYYLKAYTMLSLEKIGQKISVKAKDHSTVLDAIRVVKNLIETDKEYASDFIELTKIIDSKIHQKD
jgi:chromosomal replication initiation ATPase DnaA